MLYLVGLLIEVTVLFYFERKAWGTILTPLNILMLPYVAVLLISVGMAGHSGFVEFYYPSILIWIVGLPLFALPSFLLAGYAHRNGYDVRTTAIDPSPLPRLFVAIGTLLVLMMMYHLLATVRSSKFLIGSDEFAEEFVGFGFWGHLKHFCSIMLMLYIYYVDRHHRWLWLLIVPLVLVSVINMVKGAIIIPPVVGVMLRVASGRTRVTLRLLLWVVLAGVAVFFVTFGAAVVIVNDINMNAGVAEWIWQRFVHYFSSGTLGLSVDMALGVPDRGPFTVIWTPFINILNQITGTGEILSPVNPTFHFTGISLTNVRTFFGTLFIYTSPLQFALYTVGLSALCYTLKLLSVRFPNPYTNTIFYYYCALLAMGWFEFYFFHLDVIETPVMIILLHLLATFVPRRDALPLRTM